MNLNEQAWNTLFVHFDIVNKVNANGYFDITAKQIKKIGGREPRLMTKFDYKKHLPAIMRQHQMALLAIENGIYKIGRFNPYIEVAEKSIVHPITVTFPHNILSINPQKIEHESLVLDASHVSGILTRIFGEEVNLTIRGRTRNAPFSFQLDNMSFSVSGVQIEVDGGYEGATSINLVEAKIGSSSTVNLRQLLYPHLVWQGLVNGKKSVNTYICFYQEPVLRFIPVQISTAGDAFADHANEQAFMLEPPAQLNLNVISVKKNALLPVISAPFPQANRFDRVLAMLQVVARERQMTKEELAQLFDESLDLRDVGYYASVLQWLGFVTIKNGVISMTSSGFEIASTSHAERMRILANIVFGEPIFHHALHDDSTPIPLKLFERWRIGNSTPARRLSTIKAWVKYFKEYVENQRN